MFVSIPTNAHQVIEHAKQKELAERILLAKEQAQQQYNANMQQLAQNAVNEAKKSNALMQKSLSLTKESKYLSKWAIVIAIISILVSIFLHFA